MFDIEAYDSRYFPVEADTARTEEPDDPVSLRLITTAPEPGPAHAIGPSWEV
ncbi:hypothetical protein [Streptomyces sp. NPDC057877]|uniref:hypothetical protein n=1 Tax=Streptomyces sp. NPDC057877 TaxID=3346269 RepID=UPI0036B0455C